MQQQPRAGAMPGAHSSPVQQGSDAKGRCKFSRGCESDPKSNAGLCAVPVCEEGHSDTCRLEHRAQQAFAQVKYYPSSRDSGSPTLIAAQEMRLHILHVLFIFHPSMPISRSSTASPGTAAVQAEHEPTPNEQSKALEQALTPPQLRAGSTGCCHHSKH